MVVVANLQVVVAKLQCGVVRLCVSLFVFARCLCSSVVDGCGVSDATTWTIGF